MFEEHKPVSRDDVCTLLRSRSIDLEGFAAIADVEGTLPEPQRPSRLAEGMETFVVFAKRSLRGVTHSRHLPSKQLAGGRTLRALDLAAEELARWLERRGHLALPVSTAALDFETRSPLGVTPAGQGSELLRQAAVVAGLGTWGLNRMILTRRFGPRIHLGGVMTTLEIEADSPLTDDLCLGLEECGRCAAICPEDAIPRRARLGSALEEARGLDRVACARSCQPFGFQSFEDHLVHIFESTEAKEMWTRMRSRKTGEMWTEMAMMKEGSLTGCSECVQVCPVGEDYDQIRAGDDRSHDLPDELPHHIKDGWYELENLGPQIRRATSWDREKRK